MAFQGYISSSYYLLEVNPLYTFLYFLAFFIRPFYKMILGLPITLKDMESVDVEIFNSIQYIKDNDPEPLCLTYAINKTVFGEVHEQNNISTNTVQCT